MAALVWLGGALGAQPAGKSTSTPPAEPTPRPDRALYVWDAANRLSRIDAMLTLAKRQGVRRLYLGVNRAVLGQPDRLGALVARAGTTGMRVHAVVAENTWALAGKHQRGLEHVDRILAWHGRQPPGRRLAGIHLDVEVHALPAFKRARRSFREHPDQARRTMLGLLESWVDFVVLVRRRIRDADPALEVSVAIPAWYHGSKYAFRFKRDGHLRSVVGHVMVHVDEVVVMAYAREPRNVIRLARGELDLARRFPPVRVRVAVNISPRSPAAETMFPGGSDGLRAALKQVEKAFSDRKAFSGTAIHMLAGLEAWKPL